MFSTSRDIVSVVERPDLVPQAAQWIWEEWARDAGRTLEQVCERLLSRTSSQGPEQCFFILEDGKLAGTASLTHQDLPHRPDLTPWLASVYIEKTFRHKGYASQLVRHVEMAAKTSEVTTLWLGTATATSLYSRLGWKIEGPVAYERQVMRRDL